MKVYSIAGTLVFKQVGTKGMNTVDLSSTVKGYIVKVMDSSQIPGTRKIMRL